MTAAPATASARIVRAAGAAAAIALGAALIVRPFASVGWTALALAAALIAAGVTDLADRANRESLPRLTAATAAIVVGVVLLLWRGLSVFGIAVAAAVGLTAWGLGRWARALARGPAWWADALIGTAAIATAALAVSWPGVSIFLVVQAIGLGLVWRGLGALIGAIRGRPGPAAGEHRTHAVLRTVGGVVALAVTVPLVVATIVVRGDAPEPGAFYRAELAADTRPGTLLKSEPTTAGVPVGARGWRILYSTMREDRPALASGLVLAPTAATGPRPVIAWAHGTTGIAENCAPSMTAQPFANVPGLSQALDNGWIVVAADYLGMGTPGPSPYVIGEGEGRSVLDSVRAARQLTGPTLSDRTVVWGHSQGGHAALWTELLAPTYAPDAGVIATAALAPASDLSALATSLESMAGGSLLASYVIDSYARNYPDVRYDDYLKVQAQLPVRGMAARCLTSPTMPASLAAALFLGTDFYSADPTTGALGARLRQNTPGARLPYPTFIAQGLSDEVIAPASQNAFTQAQCTVGSDLEYRTYPGLGHMGVVADGSPSAADLVTWTQARFAGAPPTPNCAGR
ncbi:MAG: lipase family protein [Gordonia sp. (in: high G+C Gram-positive bacteria)]|uniref:lipase family protein n=1 Tax=Gordonia sp. (in: high G+C Gram-positive bacteria) TaxID=84139 RepID=UPI003C77F088